MGVLWGGLGPKGPLSGVPHPLKSSLATGLHHSNTDYKYTVWFKITWHLTLFKLDTFKTEISHKWDNIMNLFENIYNPCMISCEDMLKWHQNWCLNTKTVAIFLQIVKKCCVNCTACECVSNVFWLYFGKGLYYHFIITRSILMRPLSPHPPKVSHFVHKSTNKLNFLMKNVTFKKASSLFWTTL